MWRWLMMGLLVASCAEYKKQVKAANEMRSKGAVTVEYDEFKKTSLVSYQTVVDIEDVNVKQRQRLNWPTVFEVNLRTIKSNQDGLSLLSVNSRGNGDWMYLKCHSLTLLVDGASVPLETEHDGNVGSGVDGVSISEYVTAEIDLPTLLVMSNAKEVRGQLCNDKFSLSPVQIATLKDFVSQAALAPAPEPSSSPNN